MKTIRKVFTLMLVCLLGIMPIINIFADTLPKEGFNQVVKEGEIVNSVDPTDGVSVSKIITETKKDGTTNLENYFDITLTVKTKSQAKEQDLAIVIVMDISNTMLENDVEEGVSRLDAAMSAGEQLINDFATYSTGVSAVRKIGYVAFNTHANQIFALSNCKSSSTANNLINTMKTSTENIINNTTDDKVYAKSIDRFTNIEGGLKMAHDMLYTGEGASIQNKYIIILSDGFPTTYLKTGYTGYNTYTPNATKSGSGGFYDHVLKVPVKYGTSYSDEAAKRAQNLATTIKNKGTKIYAVGTGISDGIKTIAQYITGANNSDENKPKITFSVIDRTTETYAIGETVESFRRWLGGTGDATNPGIASGYDDGYYFNTTDSDSLSSAYQKIFADIKSSSDASWVAEDPMNTIGTTKNIEFVGLYNDSETQLFDNLTKNLPQAEETNKISNTATYQNDKINWDLKKSAYTTEQGEDGVTYYHYKVKYRVRLKNENKKTDAHEAFKEYQEYFTNGRTTLTYIVNKTDEAPVTKTIDFPIPSVMGYLGELSFNKISSFDGRHLPGATFELIHASDCDCHKERVSPTINTVSKVSAETTGLVSFTNIPSGHKYILKETNPPANHIKNETEYTVIVSYGVTKVYQNGVEIKLDTISNDIQKGNLTISKVVQSEEETKTGIFKFKIEVINNGIAINGNFKYKLNEETERNITFTNGIAEIELSHNDTITISGLPYTATYKVTELNTEGYSVEYCVNSENKCPESNNIQIGNVVESQIEIGDNNKVEFINITSFILPATGSSGSLILIIIGSLLLIAPVIYIISMFYKRERKVS